ncbi:hypothetical protein EHP00_2287 [Ecytonucleospora hepatopenaei]|uniref:Uncharacterized protein n=1 Tax=Ecytonucleospora hepatopenaei TaxID=646526 RepID=A0A1W0E3M0_9MICR|nr:hypothetical protein EHP00_2287 [Ecytonucleospora hepatopenaei]
MLVSDYFKYNFILDTSTITINDNNILRIEDFFYNKNKIYNDNKNKIYNDTIYNDNKIYNKNNNTIYDKKVNKFII